MATTKSTPRKGKPTPKFKYRTLKPSSSEIPKLASLDCIFALDQGIRELTSIRHFVLHEHGHVLPNERIDTMRLVAHCCHGILDGITEMLEASRSVRNPPKAVQS